MRRVRGALPGVLTGNSRKTHAIETSPLVQAEPAETDPIQCGYDAREVVDHISGTDIACHLAENHFAPAATERSI